MHDIVLFAQQHLALSLALILLLAALGLVEWLRSKRDTQRLSPALAVHMMNHQQAIVLDIRTAEAFSAGHIVNAISIPFSELETKIKKLEAFKTRSIIVACATGLDSTRAISVLITHGFNTLFLLADGIRGWKNADLPLIKD